MHKQRLIAIAALAAFATTGSAFAQTPGLPGSSPATAASSASPGAPVQQGQAGVVYAGKPVMPSAGSSLAQGAPMAPATSTQPGAPLPGQGQADAPPLPPLPGNLRSAARLATDDTLPHGLAEQVKVLRQRMEDIEAAADSTPRVKNRPVSRTQEITQASGEEPPAIRTALRTPTNIVFMDATGAPWPIAHAVPGDSSQFDVLVPSVNSPNLQIRPKTPRAYGGLSVQLVNNPIPISLTLGTGSDEVDVRVDLRVMQRGPNAKAPIIDRGFVPNNAASDASLIGFLDGVPPSGAKEIKTSSRNVKAWVIGEELYLRTDAALISPLWTDSVSSPNGITRTYQLTNVPSIVVSLDGQMIPVAIGQ